MAAPATPTPAIPRAAAPVPAVANCPALEAAFIPVEAACPPKP